MWRADDDGCGGWGVRDASMWARVVHPSSPTRRGGGRSPQATREQFGHRGIGCETSVRSVVDGGIVAGVDDGEERERLSVAPRVEVVGTVEPLAELECVGLAALSRALTVVMVEVLSKGRCGRAGARALCRAPAGGGGGLGAGDHRQRVLLVAGLAALLIGGVGDQQHRLGVGQCRPCVLLAPVRVVVGADRGVNVGVRNARVCVVL